MDATVRAALASCGHYVHALRRGWPTIVLFAVLGMATALALTLATDKVYEASAAVAPGGATTGPYGGTPVSAQSIAEHLRSYASVAAEPAVTGPVIKNLKLRLTDQQLAKDITVDARQDAVLVIHVTGQAPVITARLANEIAVQFDKVVLASTTPSLRLRLVHIATVPAHPIRPRPLQDIGLGAALGLLIGLGFTVVRVLGRHTVRRSGDPLLGARMFRHHSLISHAARGSASLDRSVDRHRPRSGGETRDKRRDIQGLRAVAVLVVVLFHAGWSALPGGYVGVDVFFVISGFLITGNISRRLAGGQFTLFGFYANRARRLLPAAFVTIAATCLVSYLVLPAGQFRNIGQDGLASAYYVVNWRMSARSVDYLAREQAVSPFQHFWSLAVEEQYYLIWPLLLVTVFLIGRAAGHRNALLLAAALVLVPSFLYSVAYTSSHPSQAYFVTTTRMWELAVGGLVALTTALWDRLPQVLAAMVGWLGVAGIIYAALEYGEATVFPGSAAALPVVAAAAVILAGPAAGRVGPVSILGGTVAVFIGNVSYSLYLWHWPIIVFVSAYFTGVLPLWAGLLAGAGSVVPAYLSYRFVEMPGMRSATFASTSAGLRLGFITTMSGAVAAMLLLAFIPEQNLSKVSVDASGAARDVQGRVVKVGAEVLRADPRGDPAGAPKDHFDSITPSPLTAGRDDLPPRDPSCMEATKATDNPCVFGDLRSAIQIDLVGDSHAMQWSPAFAAAGIVHHWRVVTHTKGGCPFTTAFLVAYHRPYTECQAWNRSALKAILAEQPDLVVTSEMGGNYVAVEGGTYLTGSDNTRAIVNGYVTAWQNLTSHGLSVAALAETPRPVNRVTECVAANLQHLSKCAGPRAEMIQSNTTQEIAAERASVPYLDFNDIICPTSQCAAVIGGVLVYRDGSHLSATFVRTTASYVGARITPFIKVPGAPG